MDDIVGVFHVVTIGTWSFLAVTHLAGLPHPTVPRLVVFWLTALAVLPLLRAAIRVVGRRQAAYVQDVIIVGSGQVARLLESKIKQHPEYHLRVLGFVDRDGGASLNGAGRLQLIGDTDDLPGLVRSYGADRVVITFSSESDEQTLDVIRRLQDTNVQIDIVPRMFEILGTNAQLHTIEGLPLVGLPRSEALPAPPDCSSAHWISRVGSAASSCLDRCSSSLPRGSGWTRTDQSSSDRFAWAREIELSASSSSGRW